jgi:DNA (cytosine-5)-methyltransferase 1
MSKIKVLNLYAGLGGNIFLLDESKYDITNVEWDEKIADQLRLLKPNQIVIVADAHQYILDHYHDFDIIWTSPPCQKHSKMVKFTRHKKASFIDGKLMEEIIFLKHFFKVKWIVENVTPYYEPYPGYRKIGRHLFWSNFEIKSFETPQQPKNFINLTTVESKNVIMDWLGIHYENNIYYGNNHCPVQILRNCVHPLIGLNIIEQSIVA